MGTYPPRRCGIGDYTADLAVALAKQGVDVTVLTYHDGQDSALGTEEKVQIVRELVERPTASSLLRSLKRIGPDVVHFQSATYLHSPFLNWSLAEACNGALTTTVHDTPWSWRAFYPIPSLRRIYRKSARLIVHSENTARVLREFHKVDSTKIRVIPHGVDIRKFSPETESSVAHKRYETDGKRVVLYFGFLRPNKSLDVLLRAWTIIEGTHPSATLVVAGGSPSRALRYHFGLKSEATFPQELRRYAETLGIGKRTLFVGYVAPDLVPGVFAMAEVVVVPYAEDPRLSGPLHKALSCGKAIVAVQGPLAQGFLEDGRNAVLVPRGDSQALARAIDSLLVDAGCVQKLGRQARATAEAQLGWEAVARRTASMYGELH